MITIHPDSHTDHLTEAQLAAAVRIASDRLERDVATGLDYGPPAILEIVLPAELGAVACALHGPAMGDDPVTDAEAFYAVRGDRAGQSRLVSRPPRETSIVTVIAGPHAGEPWVLFTAHGGPAAPQEPWLLSDDAARAESEAFWSTHALSAE